MSREELPLLVFILSVEDCDLVRGPRRNDFERDTNAGIECRAEDNQVTGTRRATGLSYCLRRFLDIGQKICQAKMSRDPGGAVSVSSCCSTDGVAEGVSRLDVTGKLTG